MEPLNQLLSILGNGAGQYLPPPTAGLTLGERVLALEKGLGVDGEDRVAAGFAMLGKIPAVRVDTVRLDPAVMTMISDDVATRHHALPLWYRKGVLTVAAGAALHPKELQLEIAKDCGKPVRIFSASLSAIRRHQQMARSESQPAKPPGPPATEWHAAAEESVLFGFVQSAIAVGASEILIAGQPTGTIYLRGAAGLISTDPISSEAYEAILKQLWRRNHGRDSKSPSAFPMTVGPYDISVQLVGERAAARLRLSLQSIPNPSHQIKQAIAQAYTHRDGLVVVATPHRQGKTVLLHHFAAAASSDRFVVSTTRMNGAAHFACLADAIRCAPDVLIVDDLQTDGIEEALMVSNTGTLVLVSVSNSTVADALKHLGWSGNGRHRQLNWRLGMTQRLLRQSCTECSKPGNTSNRRCDQCRQGYAGAIAVTAISTPDRCENELHILRESAESLIRLGRTTIDEVERVLPSRKQIDK